MNTVYLENFIRANAEIFHYNVFTQNSEALESYAPEELAEINPLDAKQLDVTEGKRVKVVSRRGELETKIRITERVPQGMIFMTFHYMDTPTNVLTMQLLIRFPRRMSIKLVEYRSLKSPK